MARHPRAQGLPGPAAAAEAAKIAQLQGGNGNPAGIPQFIRADFAGATHDVLIGMAVIMGLAALVACAASSGESGLTPRP